MFNPRATKSTALVGIDISGDTLRFIHMGSSRHDIQDIYTCNISSMSDEDIAHQIQAYCEESKARNAGVLTIVPSHQVITRNIELPSVDPDEIKEIINLQASRYTPHSREDIIVDYINIEVYKQNYTKALLVIVSKNIIRRYIDILKNAGLTLENVYLAPESLAWSASKIFKIKSSSNTPINMIHIDETHTDFTIVSQAKVIFIRNIPLGCVEMAGNREQSLQRFTDELKKSLEAYLSEDIGKRPGEAFITGAVEMFVGAEETISDNLLLPVKILPYEKYFHISKSAAQNLEKEKGVSLLALMGVMSAGKDLKVNLIPQEVKIQRQLEERSRDMIKTGILILIIFILGFSVLLSNMAFKSVYISNLETKYKPINEAAEKLEDSFSKITLIRNYQSKRGYSLLVLTEIYQLIPSDLELNFIRYDSQGRFSIRGTARSMSTVFYFVDHMEKSEFLKNVKTKYTAKRKDGLRDVTDFEISCLLASVSD